MGNIRKFHCKETQKQQRRVVEGNFNAEVGIIQFVSVVNKHVTRNHMACDQKAHLHSSLPSFKGAPDGCLYNQKMSSSQAGEYFSHE